MKNIKFFSIVAGLLAGLFVAATLAFGGESIKFGPVVAGGGTGTIGFGDFAAMDTKGGTLGVSFTGGTWWLEGQATAVCTSDGGGAVDLSCTWDGTGWVPTGIAATGLTNPLVADIDAAGFNIDDGGVVFLIEQAEADGAVAASGQIWVDTAVPNRLMFTDDADTDFNLIAPPINNLGDATNSGAVAVGVNQEYGQVWTWNPPDPTVEATFIGLTLEMDLDATSDATTQIGLSIERKNGTGTTAMETMLQIFNRETGAIVDKAIRIHSDGGAITVGLEVNDSDIVTAIDIGTNDFKANGVTVQAADWTLVSELSGDSPAINCFDCTQYRFNNLGDATATGAVQMGTNAEFGQVWSWNLPDTEVGSFTALTLNVDHDSTTGNENQNILVLSRINGAGTRPMEQMLLIQSLELDAVVTKGIEITANFAGGIAVGLQVSDGDITTAIALGDNDVTVDSKTIDATEFGRLDTIDAALVDLNDSPVWTGAHDFGGATLEIANSDTLPATCTVGEVYHDTNAAADARFNFCHTTNNWIALPETGGGGSGSMTTVKVDDSGIGGADIVVLDFLGADFDVQESPDTEVQIFIQPAIARLASPTFTGGITVPDNSISDEELDEGATFVWTGSHDFSAVTTVDFAAVTAVSFTADASASPAMTLNDSDNSGQVSIEMSDAAGPEAKMQLRVDTGSGTLTTFIELDGVAETTRLLRPLIVSNGTSSGLLQIMEPSGSGTNNLTFIVPALAADTDYTWPADDGDNLEVLQTNGSGVLEWVANAGGGFDSTAVDATTWSDNANASNIWTFDVSGTDHTLTASSALMTFSHGVTVTGALTATLTGTSTGVVANGINSDAYTDGSIDLVHMSINSIDSDQYVDGSIDFAHMSPNSVGSAAYDDGSIDVEHLSDNSIDKASMVDNAIGEAEMDDNAIGLPELKGGVDGELYTFDVNGDPAFVSVGINNQVLTSNGLGLAPTFQASQGGAPGTDSVGTVELDDGAETPFSGEWLQVDGVDQAGIVYRTDAEARTDLGLVIGTNVQAWDAELDTIAGLTENNDAVLFVTAGVWTADTSPAIVGTDITGTATAFTASNVTTNADLTGHITSTGNATLLGIFSSAQLVGALSDEGAASTVMQADGTWVSNSGGATSEVRSMYWGAGAMSADGTNCLDPSDTAAIGGAGGPQQYLVDCTLSGSEVNGDLFGSTIMPDSWTAASTVTFTVSTVADIEPAAAETFFGNMSAQCVGDGELVSTTWGTKVTLDIVWAASDDIWDTTQADSAAVTPAGTCAGGDTLFWYYELCDTDATADTGCTTSPATAIALTKIIGLKMEYSSDIGD